MSSHVCNGAPYMSMPNVANVYYGLDMYFQHIKQLITNNDEAYFISHEKIEKSAFRHSIKHVVGMVFYLEFHNNGGV